MMRAVGTACGAGVASAALHAASLLGLWAAVTLGFLAPLPIAAISLSRHGELGSIAVGVAALTAFLLSGSGLAALSYGAVIGVPSWGLARSAMRRTRDGAWPEAGGLLTASSALGLGLLGAGLVVLLARGGASPGLAEALLSQVQRGMSAGSVEIGAEREAALAALARILPGALVLSWLLMHGANALLAQALLGSQGAQARPSPSLASLAVPRWVAALAAIAVVTAAFAPDPAGMVGVNVALVVALPLALLGLSVVHVFAYRRGNPRIWLILAYGLIILLGWPIVLVGALGFLETWLGLRRRMGAGPGA